MTRVWSVIVLALVACAEATPVPSGPVVVGPAVTEVSRELRVCLDKSNLSIGAQIRFRRSVCRPRVKTAGVTCRDQESGAGRVLRLIDERCAVVALTVDSDVRSGDAVDVLP